MSWATIGGESGTSLRADVFIQIEPNKPKRIHALLEPTEEPKSYWTHWIQSAKQSVICPGKASCPACGTGTPARMQHSMNVWDYAEKKVKVLEKGNQVYESIKMYYEMGGNSLDKVDIVIKQIGTGKDTKYIVVSVAVTSMPPADAFGQRHDLEALCIKTTPQKISELLGAANFQPDVTHADAEEPKITEYIVDEAADIKVESSEVVMPTGKYKGQRLSDIVKTDRNYVMWVNDNFTDDDVLEAAKAALDSIERSPIQPPMPKVNPKVAEAKGLIQQFQDRGGELKAVAQIMKDTAKKTLIKDFTEDELNKFIESMKDVIESLEHAI